MAPHVVALITVASEPYPCRRIQKVRKTLLRTSGRVYRALAFDALHHGKFTCHVLRELSNFCCLPVRAGGSPNGLDQLFLDLCRKGIYSRSPPKNNCPSNLEMMHGDPNLRSPSSSKGTTGLSPDLLTFLRFSERAGRARLALRPVRRAGVPGRGHGREVR